MRLCFPESRHLLARMLGGSFALALFAGIALADYPPPTAPATGQPIKGSGGAGVEAIIYSNTHIYGFGADPNAVVIRVDVHNNYFGDFTKYHWVYTVHNNSYEPNPGSSNGFSGFETMLPAPVPDIANISAPDGIGPWLINTFSGAPVEWDLPNTPGAPVGGGTLPGQVEVYAFSTLPRLIVPSGGWFHTWENDIQTAIVSYPPGNEIEVPDVLSEPNRELCCTLDPNGPFVCVLRPVGECAALGGSVVATCDQCPGIVKTRKATWGKVKTTYR